MDSHYQYADLEISFQRNHPEPQSDQQCTCQIGMRFRLPNSDGETDLTNGLPGTASFDLNKLRQELDDTAYGQKLGKALFTEQRLITAFTTAKFVAKEQGAYLRVRLAISQDLLQLHALQWEKLIFPEERLPIFQDETVLFSRYLISTDPRPIPRPKPRDVKALIVIARPANPQLCGVPDIPIADALLQASTAFKDIHATQLLDNQATLDALRDKIRNGYDLIYLVAHGKLVDNKPQIGLVKENQAIDWIDGQELADRIGQLECLPKLIVLASCVSAGAGNNLDSNVLAAIGPLLVRKGVPAVIAMQGKIGQTTTLQFMKVLFEQLSCTGLIDQAVAIARSKIRERLDWWAPVLFMRLESGLLFDTTKLVPNTKPPEAETIRQALGKLNYGPQNDLFRRYCRKQRGAFFISGRDQRAGQRWLLCRLLRSLPAWQQRNVLIKLDLAGLRCMTLHADLIWEKVAEQLGLDPGVALPTLMDTLATRWQQNHLLFIFLNVTAYLDIIVEEVWASLTQYLSETTGHRNQLLLFVTNDDEPLPTIAQIIPDDQLYADGHDQADAFTVRLPELPDRFQRDEIDRWIYDEQQTLTSIVQDPALVENPEDLLNEIWVEDEGTPMPTLKTIYRLCMPAAGGLRWSVVKKQWTEVY